MNTPARPRPAARPVRVRNAVCPKCDGPVLYDPERWLLCGGRCAALAAARTAAAAIPFTTLGTKGGAR
jgi:hypothetical protein